MDTRTWWCILTLHMSYYPIFPTSPVQGVPELVLALNNSRMLDDISLHPCVRYKRWEQVRFLVVLG